MTKPCLTCDAPIEGSCVGFQYCSVACLPGTLLAEPTAEDAQALAEYRAGGAKRKKASPPAPVGLKHDEGKLRLSKLPWDALREVSKVMHFGADKYAWDSWRGVEAERYVDAAIRHLAAHVEGELTDDESKLPHLAHAATSVLFALALSLRGSS